MGKQAFWTKHTKPSPPNQTKLLVKAVDSWVRSAVGNVYLISIFTVHTLFCLIICSLYFWTKDSLSAQYDVFHCYPFFCIVSPVLKMSEIYVLQQMTWQCFGWVWKLDTATSDYKVHMWSIFCLLIGEISEAYLVLSHTLCQWIFVLREKALNNQFSETWAGQRQQRARAHFPRIHCRTLKLQFACE